MGNVATPNKQYTELVPSWDKVRTLMAGTKAMRAAGKLYLPPQKGEDISEDGTPSNYATRLSKATLAPFFRLTVNNFVGRIFAKPVALQKDVSDTIKEWCENVDRQGSHINVFFVSVVREAIAKGSAWVMVDYPRAQGVMTLQDERQAGLRPYLTLYNAESVIAVRTDDTGNIVEARIKEDIEVDVDEFESDTITQVRRLIRDAGGVRFEIWQQTASNEWRMIPELSGTMTIDEIPLVPLFTNTESPGYSPPPLLDLADQCIKFWQQQSEQDNVTEVARFPIFAVSGWSKDDKPIQFGPRMMMATSEASGKFYYVEHTGAAIAAGRAELERLEEQIAMEGTRPLQQTRSTATATQIESEDATVKSTAQIWGELSKDAIEKCLALMAKWAGMGEDAGGSVVLDGDFDVVGADAIQMQQLATMRASRDISRLTLWAEMQRRGVLDDSFDREAESARLEEEGIDGLEMNV